MSSANYSHDAVKPMKVQQPVFLVSHYSYLILMYSDGFRVSYGEG